MGRINVFVDGNHPRKDGSMSVKFRVTGDDGRRFFVDTGMSTMVRFSGRSFPRREKHASVKTSRLNLLYDEMEAFMLRNPGLGSSELAVCLREIVGGGSPKVKLLADYVHDYAGLSRTSSTREMILLTEKKVRSFDATATLDINVSWLEQFDRWLEEQGSNVNGRGIHMRNLRAVVNWCIDNEWCEKYPFRRFKIRREDTRKRSLSVERVRQLRDWPLEGREAMYRDLWMLSFYLCGANAVDLLLFRPGDIERFEGRRRKTGQRFDLPVTPEIRAIIDRWRGRDYLLCPMDTNKSHKNFLRNWNEGLQNIGRDYRPHYGYRVKAEDAPFAGLTTYWARHTWATIAARLDIPKEVIGRCLTHSWSQTVTDTYIDFDWSKVDDAVRRVIAFVNGEEKGADEDASPGSNQ